MSYAVKWKYQNFPQNHVREKLFYERYKSFAFAKQVADSTFWEHRVGGILIARVSAEVVQMNKRARHQSMSPQGDLFSSESKL